MIVIVDIFVEGRWPGFLLNLGLHDHGGWNDSRIVHSGLVPVMNVYSLLDQDQLDMGMGALLCIEEHYMFKFVVDVCARAGALCVEALRFDCVSLYLT